MDRVDIRPIIKPLGYVPIYKPTDDKRIIHYLKQQISIDDLQKGIPEMDVLSKCQAIPTHDAGSEGFEWKKFWIEALAFFGCGVAVFAMFFFFAAIWGAA